jgi:DNA mismatch repair ATPase MutS
MKAFLMHRDKDFDLDRALPPNEGELTPDLELERLFDAMALGDKFLSDVARKAVLSSLQDPGEIVYRQHVLEDCVAQPSVVREIYGIAVDAIEGERKVWRSFLFRYPDAILHGSIELLQLFMGQLRKLRRVADDHADTFRSEGFAALFEMLERELDDEYFRSVDVHLQQLRFREGVLISARLGKGAKGADYILRRPRTSPPRWRQWIPFMGRSPYTLVIAERDENGFKALSELRGRGINLAANALAQSTDHILSFFSMLRVELGFYVGCLNLRGQLVEKGEPVCFPAPVASGRPLLSCRGLYDACLSLSLNERVVGNDVNADDKRLVMITGANQGGKSTFLRSIGLAQLMMQSGMFVAAEGFRSTAREALFTHYKREEDPTMKSGKLDEELSRMSEIVDRVTPNGIVLFNESFSATNEREGAEIASAIIRALLEAGLTIFFVTHSFELAHGFHAQGLDAALFLRAERRPDGRRTFRLVEGDPLPTSYGEDLYTRIFEKAS